MTQFRKLASNIPTGKAFSFIEEFKQFALKGNVIDLAIGVIIGGAFGKVVDSLVKQVLMPLIAVVMPSEQSYTDWKVTVAGSEIPYGLFLGEVVNFLIVAFALFLFISKFLGWIAKLRKKAEPAGPPPRALSKDQELLTEIRDLLKARQGESA